MNERKGKVISMNKQYAFEFFDRIYQDIVVGMKVEKIPYYFSEKYIQTTDGVTTNINEVKDHIYALKNAVESLVVSPFHDFLFDDAKQTATLRYTVTAHKKNGEVGNIEVIAIFELDDDKVLRCNEQSCPLEHKDGFGDLAKIS